MHDWNRQSQSPKKNEPSKYNNNCDKRKKTYSITTTDNTYQQSFISTSRKDEPEDAIHSANNYLAGPSRRRRQENQCHEELDQSIAESMRVSIFAVHFMHTSSRTWRTFQLIQLCTWPREFRGRSYRSSKATSVARVAPLIPLSAERRDRKEFRERKCANFS